MMKYVVLGLILIAASLDRAPATAPQVLPASASAMFGTASAGVTTKVPISVDVTPGAVQISLSVQQDARECDHAGGCHDQPVISGFTIQDVGANNARIDRVLGRAFVHATIALPDGVSRAAIPVRIDAIWSNAGPQACNSQVVYPYYDRLTCVRTATVIADVSVGPTLVIRNQTVPDGWLNWQG